MKCFLVFATLALLCVLGEANPQFFNWGQRWPQQAWPWSQGWEDSDSSDSSEEIPQPNIFDIFRRIYNRPTPTQGSFNDGSSPVPTTANFYPSSSWTPDGYASSSQAASDYASSSQAPSDYVSSSQAPSDYASSSQAPSDYASSSQAPNDYASSSQAPSDYASSSQAASDSVSSSQAPIEYTSSSQASAA